MAGAVAEAGASEEAAEILKRGLPSITRLRWALAGRTHAPNPLPRLGFATYIAAHRTIPRGLPRRAAINLNAA